MFYLVSNEHGTDIIAIRVAHMYRNKQMFFPFGGDQKFFHDTLNITDT